MEKQKYILRISENGNRNLIGFFVAFDRPLTKEYTEAKVWESEFDPDRITDNPLNLMIKKQFGEDIFIDFVKLNK